MIAEGRIRESLCHERDHRHKAAVTQRKLLLAAPHLAEQHIVIQRGKFWRKRA